jgi:hypothetical protein
MARRNSGLGPQGEDHMITVTVDIQAARAVRAGRAESGRHEVAISQPELDALTAPQREALARVLERTERVLDGAIEPTVAEVVRLLDAETEARDAKMADAQARLAAHRHECEAVIRDRRLQGHPPNLAIRWPYAGSVAEYEALPEVVAWQAEIDEANAAEQAADRERREAATRAQEATALAEAAARTQYLEAAAEMVRVHGSPNQRERLEADLLPEYERDLLVHDLVFAALAKFSRYQRLVADDAPHVEDCCEDASLVKFASADEYMLTDAQWVELQAIRAAAPQAIATAKWHRVQCTGDCANDDAALYGLRWSVRVEIAWHGRTLSREYYFPAGVLRQHAQAV